MLFICVILLCVTKTSDVGLPQIACIIARWRRQGVEVGEEVLEGLGIEIHQCGSGAGWG